MPPDSLMDIFLFVNIIFSYLCIMIDLNILISDYLKMRGMRRIFFDFLPALILSVIIFFPASKVQMGVILDKWLPTATTISGILLGFLVSILAMIATSNNESIEKAKEFDLNIVSHGKKKYLFDELMAMNALAIVSTTFTLLFFAILLLCQFAPKVFLFLSIFLLFFCIAFTRRIAFSLYHIFSVRRDS